MRFVSFYSFTLILVLAGPLNILDAGGQQEAQNVDKVIPEEGIEAEVQKVLSYYNPENLSVDDALAIHEAFREHGLQGGPELNDAVKAAGFDPEKLKELAPPRESGMAHKEAPREEKDITEDRDPGKVYEALSSDLSIPGFVLSSPAVEKGILLEQYRCEKKVQGKENSIALSWKNVPEGTESLAIVMYHFPDPEDPGKANSYLLLWGIDPSVENIPYGEAYCGDWYMGQNKDGDVVSYTSPCCQSPGSHEYVITLFALAEYPGDLPRKSTVEVDFNRFMDAIGKVRIIAKSVLVFKA